VLGLERGFVALGKILALVREAADYVVGGEPLFVHPRKLRKYLKVAPVARREGHQSLGATRWPRPFQEFDKSRPSRQQSFVIDLKSARENLDFIFARQAVGVFEGQREPGLVEFPAGVFLDLHAEGRHNVEGGMKPGRFLKHANHAPVVLDRVKASPRKNVATGFGVAILGLVHMPQDHQMNAIHRARPGHARAALVLHSPLLSCASWTATLSAKFFVMRSLDSSFLPLFSSFHSLSG